MPKEKIHPNYAAVRVLCACGSNFETRSTHKGDIHVEICSACHPFFTGKQRLVDTAGRVERFRRKYAKAEAQSHQPATERLLLGRCCCHSPVGLGELATEALDAACCIHQALLAGEERVANRADFHVNVALVGRTGLKVASASALDLHCGVIGMNLFLGHLSGQTFPAILLL